MKSIKNKLTRLKAHINHDKEEKGVKDEAPLFPESATEEIPFLDQWKEAGVELYFSEQDYCFIREVRYTLDTFHGKYRLGEFQKAVKAWNDSPINHPLSTAGYQPEDLFFFDTETTGLGGGTGNTIFLLGYASLKGETVVLKQHILPHPGAEVPLYKSFLENINYTNMVTYNGKSFDWPQVKTRHTLIRDHVPKLPPFGHFDLFHAAKRMWKHRLERLKLSVVEKEILEFERKDDIPGFLAPMIYFDFIERKDPEGMLGIIKHNEMDILSLISLYTHLSYQILGLDQEQTIKESYEVGRWFSYLGDSETAERVFSDLSEGDSEEAIKAKHELAFQAKKKKNWQAAVSLWEEVVKKAEPSIQIVAYVELAKIYEHRMKKLKNAVVCTETAISICKEINRTDNFDLLKRLARVRKKYEKVN